MNEATCGYPDIHAYWRGQWPHPWPCPACAAVRDSSEQMNAAPQAGDGARSISASAATDGAEGGTRSPADAAPEIRLNGDGSLDEVVADGCKFRLEQMDYNHWWLSVECGGKRVAVWLHSRGKITASTETAVVAPTKNPCPPAP